MQICRTPHLLHYTCIIFFFQQVILKMLYDEHIKSYFYCKGNPGLCYKANMLQTPCSVFPEKHTVAPWETHLPPPARPDRAGPPGSHCHQASPRAPGSAPSTRCAPSATGTTSPSEQPRHSPSATAAAPSRALPLLIPSRSCPRPISTWRAAHPELQPLN